MSEITVTVAGAARRVLADTTAADLLGADGGPDRSILAARINGQLRDLAAVVTAGDVIEAVPTHSPSRIRVLVAVPWIVIALDASEVPPRNMFNVESFKAALPLRIAWLPE